MSKPVSTCSREWGTTNTVAASDTAARITGIENTHRQVVVAMLAAAVFLHEQLRPMQLVGAGLVLLAALLASRNALEAAVAAVERG